VAIFLMHKVEVRYDGPALNEKAKYS